MRKVFLITGGLGFIGSNFIRHLISQGNTVINVDICTYAGNVNNLKDLSAIENYIFVRGDICDMRLIYKLLEEYSPSAIVNFAAESHVDRSISSPNIFINTNVKGTLSLLQASLKFWEAGNSFKFLHISTDEVYGSVLSGSSSENDQYNPNSPYSASKAASNHLVRSFNITYGLPCLTVMASNNYGRYQCLEKFIPKMIFNAMSGLPLTVYGDGENVRDWLHVEDHCRALSTILKKGKDGEVYNVGGGNLKSNNQIIKLICTILDDELGFSNTHKLLEYVPDRKGHDFRYALDISKIKSEIGWEPEVNFELGIRDTILWYTSNLEWVKNSKELLKIEQRKENIFAI